MPSKTTTVVSIQLREIKEKMLKEMIGRRDLLNTSIERIQKDLDKMIHL